MPDYFDRLLARYTPVPAAGGGGARVRPRMPGPFERIEALRTAPQEPDEPAALIPSAPGPAFGPAELIRHEREVRTDRHTVVRTEAARPDENAGRTGAEVAAPPEPLLRPAAPAAPRPRPAADVPRSARRGGATVDSVEPRTPAGSAPTAAAPPPVAAAPRPRSSEATATARAAALNGVGRRAPRPAERVVHVQIGRLEVTAAPSPGASRTAGGRPDTTARRAPALTLDDYLSRGEKRD
ncbi:hypothetical protein [Streptomyces sp. NPDC020681]|uniref:hypothetical protein n=1 Tax=Streptomyces sp. NPDC020681 TaxID=3365083 RepID=UPI0037B9CA01